jgi:hypothetical protein
MKSADEVIEAYVRDVAGYLPRSKRNDVAFELRALLQDELAAKAAAREREPDPELAMELLGGFGRPADAAARYHPRPPLVDPADNHNFLIWTVVLALLFGAARPALENAALQAVGVVFLFFAVSAWSRRRQTDGRLRWRPKREHLPEVAGWASTLLPGIATLVFPFAMYLAPEAWWRAVTFDRLPSDGLALTDAFLDSWQRPLTLFGLAMVAGTYFAAAAQGGWRKWSRDALVGWHVFLGGLLALHAGAMRSLPELELFAIFESDAANRVAMPIFGAVASVVLLGAFYDAYKIWARVDPAPSGALPPGPLAARR